MIKDNIIFLREFIQEFQTTGTLCPTSKWAANALIAPMKIPGRGPKRIAELGSGTGAATMPILHHIRPGDKVTLCEINPRFMRALKKKLERSAEYQRVKHQIEFYEGPAQGLPEHEKFDIFICSIPFLNFEVETVREIFTKLHALSTPETVMTYYEYIGLRNLGKHLSLPDRKRRLRELDTFFQGMYSECLMKRTPVWLNVLPINIYSIKTAA